MFLVAAYVPDDRWFTAGKLDFVQASGLGWRMHWNAVNDPAEQVTAVERVLEWDDGRGDQHFPHREKYCSPAEMDLMARLAGLRLRERWSTWDKGAYTGEGEAISLYVKTSTG